MKSHPRIATTCARAPPPRSRPWLSKTRLPPVNVAQVVAAESAVEATAATAVAPVTFSTVGDNPSYAVAYGPLPGPVCPPGDSRADPRGRVPASKGEPTAYQART